MSLSPRRLLHSIQLTVETLAMDTLDRVHGVALLLVRTTTFGAAWIAMTMALWFVALPVIAKEAFRSLAGPSDQEYRYAMTEEEREEEGEEEDEEDDGPVLHDSFDLDDSEEQCLLAWKMAHAAQQ
ncbi:MAG: hypothetical protein DHS80DRAFT_25912 [Piptocephalis tieghemiana]|nr:MAG: hypothetical protein DHS80DRAFT_25912 [Piptocephalis tieghemiana]